MESIITVVVAAVTIPLLFQLCYFFQRREEKRRASEQLNRTKMPRGIYWFFLGFAILGLCLMIIGGVCSIVEKEDISTVLIIVFCCSLFVALGLFGYFYTRFRYEIYDTEKVTVVRFFKSREVYFKDIAYYSYFAGIAGGLIAYDKDGVPLFSSEGINAGIDGLVNECNAHGITLVNKTYFADNFRGNPIYASYRSKTNLKIAAWICFGIGAAGLGLFALIFNSDSYQKYENYPVQGVVRECDFGDQTIEIRLQNDDNLYYVNNIVFDKVSGYLNYDVAAGDDILLYIGYKDGSGMLNVSQIELNGKVYLNMAVAEEEEYDNFVLGRFLSYIDLAVSVLLLIGWGVCLIVLGVKFKSNAQSGAALS